MITCARRWYDFPPDFPIAPDHCRFLIHRDAPHLDPRMGVDLAGDLADAQNELTRTASGPHPPAQGQASGQAVDAGQVLADPLQCQRAAFPEGMFSRTERRTFRHCFASEQTPGAVDAADQTDPDHEQAP